MIRAVYNCSANVADLAVKISKSLPGAGYLASLSSPIFIIWDFSGHNKWVEFSVLRPLGSSELFSLDVNWNCP